jgi:hypothetical protein
LLFNADGDWAHGAEPVAYVSGWTEQYQWDRYASQTTSGFELVAGESYYIEAIGVHGLGLDHLEVGWSTPGSAIEVVPADVLEPTVSGAGGWRQDATALQVAPGPVRNVVDTWVDGTTVGLTWDAPLVTDEFGVAARFVASVAGTSRIESVTEAGVTFAGLEPATSYTVEIVAVNESGSGPSVPHQVLRVITPAEPTTTTTPTTTSTTTPTTTTPTTTSTSPTTTSTTTTTTTTPTSTTTTTTPTSPTTTTTPTSPTTTTTVPSAPAPGLTAGYTILATGDGNCGGLQLSGSSIDVLGGLRSNGDVMVQGSNVTVDGIISYGGSSNVSGRVASDGLGRDLSTTVSGLTWTVADFAVTSPLGPGVTYHRHDGDWWVGDSVEPGIHYVDGDVQVSGSNVDLRGVTIVATGTVGVSGPGLELSPAAPDLPAVLSGASGCSRTGINLSASSVEWSGVLAAPDARVRVNGSDLRGGTILASSVQLSGSRIEIGRTSLADTIVDSGDPIVYLTSEHIDAAERAAKAIRKGLGS